ncbi:MAG TPA: peptidoglycan-binding protein [Reyranella sp.]|nr:peptidoglycan-binding protein [Reyranella sp.]
MSDPLDRKASTAGATFLLIGGVVVLVIAAIVVAFLTMGSSPEPLPPEQRLTQAPSAPPPPNLPSTADAGPAPTFGSDSTAATNAPAPKAATPAAAPSTETKAETPSDWTAVPLDELRERANAKELAAMEEMARRLIGGAGIPKDPQAGAGWLLRAAEAGSAQAAFNVGVMYERGFVVERDSTKAADWYRKAAKGGVAMAQHNLALLLRDGKGVARNGQEAIELLRTAARQGMAASMFSLGDIYERGDAAPKDLPMALAWYAVTAEFERQVNHGTDSALGQTALDRMQILERSLTPAELERARKMGQSEFHDIVEALSPTKPPAGPLSPAKPEVAAAPSPVSADRLLDWPKEKTAQVRAIQQALIDLKLLRDKPDGTVGPMTRSAIREFQRRSRLPETGEPGKDVYVALKQALIMRDVAGQSPLPPPPAADSTTTEIASTAPPAPVTVEPPKVEPPKVEAPKVEPPKVEPPKVEAPKIETPKAAPVVIDLGNPPAAPPPPTSAEVAREAAKSTKKIDPGKPALPPIVSTPPPPLRIDLGKVEPPPPPPTSSDFAKPTPVVAKPDPDAWPGKTVEQVKAIQSLLRDLRFYRQAPTGQNDASTRAAIRDYQHMAGLKETGEPSKALFDSLKEMRRLMAPAPKPEAR